MMTLVLVIVTIILVIILLAGIVSAIKVQKNKVNQEYFYVFNNGRKKYRKKCDSSWSAFRKFYVQTLVNIFLFNIV